MKIYGIGEMPLVSVLHSTEKETGTRYHETVWFRCYTDGTNRTAIVTTKKGITATAIYNPFCGCWFTDDVYGIIEDETVAFASIVMRG